LSGREVFFDGSETLLELKHSRKTALAALTDYEKKKKKLTSTNSKHAFGTWKPSIVCLAKGKVRPRIKCIFHDYLPFFFFALPNFFFHCKKHNEIANTIPA